MGREEACSLLWHTGVSVFWAACDELQVGDVDHKTVAPRRIASP